MLTGSCMGLKAEFGRSAGFHAGMVRGAALTGGPPDRISSGFRFAAAGSARGRTAGRRIVELAGLTSMRAGSWSAVKGGPGAAFCHCSIAAAASIPAASSANAATRILARSGPGPCSPPVTSTSPNPESARPVSARTYRQRQRTSGNRDGRSADRPACGFGVAHGVSPVCSRGAASTISSQCLPSARVTATPGSVSTRRMAPPTRSPSHA